MKEPGGVPANTAEKKVTNTASPQKKVEETPTSHFNICPMINLHLIECVTFFLIDNLHIFYRQKIRLIFTEMLNNSCLQDICTEIR